MPHLTDHDLERYHLGMIQNEDELAPLEEHLFGCVSCALQAEASASYVDIMRASMGVTPNGYCRSPCERESTRMSDLGHSWELVLAAGQRLVDAQAEEARLHRQYCKCPMEEVRIKWREARLEVGRLASMYEGEMREFRSTYLNDSPKRGPNINATNGRQAF